MGAQPRGCRRAARGPGHGRPGRNTLVLLPGCERVRSVRRGQRDDISRAERAHADPHGPVEGDPRGRRLRGAATGRSRARGRAGRRADDRAPAFEGRPPGRHRTVAARVRRQPAPDRGNRGRLVAVRDPDAPPRGRDVDEADAGGAGRPRLRDRPVSSSGCFSPSITVSRSTPGPRAPSRTSRTRSNGPVCCVDCIIRRRCASSTSPATPGSPRRSATRPRRTSPSGWPRSSGGAPASTTDSP